MTETPKIAALPGNEDLARRLAHSVGIDVTILTLHRFPDGEGLLRFDADVQGHPVVLVCSLDHPDPKLASLLFAAALARDLGASEVGLVAPYLAYMRQDRRFRRGEAITARYFADLLSHAFDWLVTVSPHLHRFAKLDELYMIPSEVTHASSAIAGWITKEVEDPLLIGPDLLP